MMLRVGLMRRKGKIPVITGGVRGIGRVIVSAKRIAS